MHILNNPFGSPIKLIITPLNGKTEFSSFSDLESDDSILAKLIREGIQSSKRDRLTTTEWIL